MEFDFPLSMHFILMYIRAHEVQRTLVKYAKLCENVPTKIDIFIARAVRTRFASEHLFLRDF